LTLNDMPAGWTTASAGTHDSRRGFCNKPNQISGYTRVAVLYDKTTAGPLVAEVLRAYKTPAEAMTQLRRSEARAASCHQFTQGSDTIRLAPLSFPKLGAATFAIQSRYPLDTFDEANVVIGNVIVEVLSGGVLSEPDLAIRYTKQAVNRVAQHQAAWMH
jgi:hypothetical protein